MIIVGWFTKAHDNNERRKMMIAIMKICIKFKNAFSNAQLAVRLVNKLTHVL